MTEADRRRIEAALKSAGYVVVRLDHLPQGIRLLIRPDEEKKG